MHFDEEYTYLAWKPPPSGLIYRSDIKSGGTIDSISCRPHAYTCLTNKTSVRIDNLLARDMFFNITFKIGKDFTLAYGSLQNLLYVNDSGK